MYHHYHGRGRLVQYFNLLLQWLASDFSLHNISYQHRQYRSKRCPWL